MSDSEVVAEVRYLFGLLGQKEVEKDVSSGAANWGESSGVIDDARLKKASTSSFRVACGLT